MKPASIVLLAFSVVVALAGRGSAADEKSQEGKLQDKIIGSWKLVSSKYGGQDFRFPEGTTMIKHVTPTQFMWVTYDKDGHVTRAAGGTYTLKGDSYEEAPEYGLSEDFEIIKGKTHKFKCQITGNTWHHDGQLNNGQTIEEVWERLERK
jgi:hypothetical protein